MPRKDVLALAAKLATDSGIDNTPAVYEFLMVCGRSMGRNPTEITWITGHKFIFPEGKRDSYYLEVYIPKDHRQAHDGDKDAFWENRILERQDELD